MFIKYVHIFWTRLNWSASKICPKRLLPALATPPVLALYYLYDFGDGWEHTIKVEDIAVPKSGGPRIRCLAGENACPPEDAGGPHAYFEFVAAIGDPVHEEHASMLQWIGGSFDPGTLDVADVNERLAAIKT